MPHVRAEQLVKKRHFSPKVRSRACAWPALHLLSARRCPKKTLLSQVDAVLRKHDGHVPVAVAIFSQLIYFRPSNSLTPNGLGPAVVARRQWMLQDDCK